MKICYPKAKSGSYVIDPDGEFRLAQGFWVYGIQALFKSGIRYISAEIWVLELGTAPFAVHCDIKDKSEVGETVIGHNSENRMLVDGCGGKGDG